MTDCDFCDHQMAGWDHQTGHGHFSIDARLELVVQMSGWDVWGDQMSGWDWFFLLLPLD